MGCDARGGYFRSACLSWVSACGCSGLGLASSPRPSLFWPWLRWRGSMFHHTVDTCTTRGCWAVGFRSSRIYAPETPLVRYAAKMCEDRAATAKQNMAELYSRVAPSYAERGPPRFAYAGRRLVELAGVGSADAVLDLGTGRGATLLPAAERVGPMGRA